MRKISLKDGERLDDLQVKGLQIIQHSKRFCFGMDAVLLSSFAKVKENEMVLDLGTGTGIIPLLLWAKTSGKHFTGIEIQKESVDMAQRSVSFNQLEEQINIVKGDIKETAQIFGHVSFDVVTTNPPYMIKNHGQPSVESEIAIARHEVFCELKDVIREGAKVLKEKGRFYMVHRPFRLVEIFKEMCVCNLEPKRVRFVHPYLNSEPNMVLIEGLKGGKSRLIVEPPLIVYEEDGNYTKELLQLYGLDERR